jgi:tetratricopeptide (TPR) repeat protein
MLRVSTFLLLLLTAGPLFSAVLAGSFDQISQQADAARAADHLNEAIRLYREGVRLHPAWREGWWSLGSLFYDQDRFPEADTAFQRFVSLTPKPGPANAFLGLCEYETRHYDSALRHFRVWASEGWAGTTQLIDVSVFHFALLLTREGKFVEALFLLSTEAAKLGNTPALSEAMGLASLRMRNLPEDYSAQRREMVWLAGEAALYAADSQRDFARADEFAGRLESRYGETPEVHYLRGNLFTFENKNADAEREFREELRLSPQHVPAMLGIATIQLASDQVAAAASMVRRATEIEPNNPETHHLLGRVLIETGNFQESAKELELAKHLAPDSALIRSHLAIAYSRLGRAEEAKAEAAAFLSLKEKEGVLAPPGKKVRHGTRPPRDPK